MDERDYILWISLIKSISVKAYYDLYHFFEDIKTLYHAKREELLTCVLLNSKIIGDIEKSKDEKILEKHMELLKSKNISFITIADDMYPSALKHIYLAPPVLYYLGNLSPSVFENTISIVGSRNASYYGLKMSEQISQELASAGITVVSGFARGIDSMAHVGTLKAKGITVAVFGNGVDVVYPKENRHLYKEIMEKGIILSEFLPGTQPQAYHFPRRNRIISGLSMGTVIIEAAEKSGSLITAKYALEQGREVYALPGNVNNSTSRGTNILIKEGAKIVTSCKDILEDIFPMFSAKDENPSKQSSLTDEEREVIKYIKLGYNNADRLYQKSQIPIKSINYILTALEIKNKLVIHKGNYYVK